MKSEIIDKETEKAMVRFNEICNEYLKKFGENSLERIIFHGKMLFCAFRSYELIHNLFCSLETL
jgi:hypothetical protein